MNELEMISVEDASAVLKVGVRTIQSMILSEKFDWGFVIRGERGKNNKYYIFRRRFLQFVTAGDVDLITKHK